MNMSKLQKRIIYFGTYEDNEHLVGKTANIKKI